ncbi:Hypothetical protein D9617_4g004340 [Elsinoe fawcettii]|nr:Hypothetical protein D9617_4g004340 [Elsinoe fawcettii]
MASNSCRVVITGVPGQGKSELCLRIVNELRSHYWGVFWVDVESRMRASEDYLRISRLLGHPVEDFRAARQQLSVEDRPWLLILDNADDHDYDYQQYIPSGWHGCILITSRNPSFSSLSTQLTINLESLSDEEARSLLVRAAGHIDLGCMWDEQEIGEALISTANAAQ